MSEIGPLLQYRVQSLISCQYGPLENTLAHALSPRNDYEMTLKQLLHGKITWDGHFPFLDVSYWALAATCSSNDDL